VASRCWVFGGGLCDLDDCGGGESGVGSGVGGDDVAGGWVGRGVWGLLCGSEVCGGGRACLADGYGEDREPDYLLGDSAGGDADFGRRRAWVAAAAGGRLVAGYGPRRHDREPSVYGGDAGGSVGCGFGAGFALSGLDDPTGGVDAA